MPPNLEVIAEQLRALTPLLKDTAEQNTKILINSAQILNKADYNDLTKLELSIEKKIGVIRQKLVIVSIFEKVVFSLIVYYLTHGSGG